MPDFRSGQGTIVPTMFVGMGGTGSRIVDRICGRAARLQNWESQLRPLTSFLALDTNKGDLNRLQHIRQGNQIHIGAFDKRKAVENFRRSNDELALQWLDRAYQPRGEIKPGAGQIRVESRLGYHFQSISIRDRLKELVNRALEPNVTWRQDTPPNFYVYMYCTLAGGTGSGSFLMMAYLIQDVIRTQGWQPRLIGNLVLSTLMLNAVPQDLHLDIHANTYAALKELEHLTKLQYPAVQLERPEGEEFVYWNNPNAQSVPRVQTSPFFLSFIFDEPKHISVGNADAVIKLIADASFLQVFTPIIDNLAGELDNYEKNLTELTRFPGDLRNVGMGFSKHFGAYGIAALVLPAADLLEYSALRFAAEALRRQITFGVDPHDTTDRARALERHRVDYEDPRFRSLSEEDRYLEINKAFVNSVQEMARQDEREEMAGAYWSRLVEDVDHGRITGTDEQGVQRGESLLSRLQRVLDEQRAHIVNEIQIKVRPFNFQREGVNAYLDEVNRLEEGIRKSRIKVEQGKTGLVTSAKEGEVIADLKLDPIAERYIVLRLKDLLDTQLIPAAQKQLKEAQERSWENPKVKEKMTVDTLQSLNDAAGKKGKIWRRADDEAFNAVRDSAQTDHQTVARAQSQFFDADLRLTQLRNLLDFLSQRARLYARLATRMNRLVQDLEAEAKGLQNGQVPVEPPLALSVEVFQTLEEPKERLWPQVYDELFIRDGRDLSTFDREILSTRISEQLRPRQDASGRFVDKSDDELVADLRRAMIDLGRDRLKTDIYGSDGSSPLTLERGLEMEAQIVLSQSGRPITVASIQDYVGKKLLALAQLAGVLARVTTEVSQTLDDGVKLSRTRQLVLWQEGVSQKFHSQLRNALARDGGNLNEGGWYNPHIAIIHDVELPIPLYYFQAIVGVIEDAYQAVANNDRRSYNLHVDYHWEHPLPNLNPQKSELTIGWSLRMIAHALLAKVVQPLDGGWSWIAEGAKPEPLGRDLSATLYRLGEIHNDKDLGPDFEKMVQGAYSSLAPSDIQSRGEKLLKWFIDELRQMGLRRQHGQTTREDILQQPVFRALRDMFQTIIEKAGSPVQVKSASPQTGQAWPL